jgi:ribosomal protein S27E
MGRKRFADVKCPECNRTGIVQTVKRAMGGLCECGRMVDAPTGRRWFIKRRTLLRFVQPLGVAAMYDVLKNTFLRVVTPSPQTVQMTAKIDGVASVKAQVISVQGLASGFKAGGATINQG